MNAKALLGSSLADLIVSHCDYERRSEVNRKISEEIVEEYLVRIETNDGWGTFNLALPNISMTNLILKNVSGLSGVGTAKIAFVEDFSLWFEAQSELMETRLASARSFERPKLREIQNA